MKESSGNLPTSERGQRAMKPIGYNPGGSSGLVGVGLRSYLRDPLGTVDNYPAGAGRVVCWRSQLCSSIIEHGPIWSEEVA